MDRVKRIWYLSPMRGAKVQASLRIRAVSPEPPLLAHRSSESRGTFRQKARSLAPLNDWACAVQICHDGMLEDTNSLDGAQILKEPLLPNTNKVHRTEAQDMWRVGGIPNLFNSKWLHDNLSSNTLSQLFNTIIISQSMTKPTKWPVRPAKTPICLGIHRVWPESSLSAVVNYSLSAQRRLWSDWASKTGRMPRLIWVFAGRTGHFDGFCHAAAHFINMTTFYLFFSDFLFW